MFNANHVLIAPLVSVSNILTLCRTAPQQHYMRIFRKIALFPLPLLMSTLGGACSQRHLLYENWRIQRENWKKGKNLFCFNVLCEQYSCTLFHILFTLQINNTTRSVPLGNILLHFYELNVAPCTNLKQCNLGAWIILHWPLDAVFGIFFKFRNICSICTYFLPS